MRTYLVTGAIATFLQLGCEPQRVAPDGPPPGCGDGVISDGSLGAAEQCDDGLENGTEFSLCHTSCYSAEAAFHRIGPDTMLPFPAKKLVWAGVLVISNFDDQGIALVPVGNTSAPVLLKRYSAPVDFFVSGGLGGSGWWVMWIERAVPGVGGPWLFWADLSEFPAPTIHELPFPASTRGDPVFVRYDWGPHGFVMVDANGHLAFVHVQDLSQGLATLTDLGPAPSGVLRHAVLTHERRTAVFFDDGPSTTVVALNTPWLTPPSVISQTRWGVSVRDVAWGGWMPSPHNQVAVLGPQGDVSLLAVGQAVVETVPPVFTRIPGEVSDIAGAQGNLFALTHEGSLYWVHNNGEGRGLKPQAFPVGPPCAVCTIAEESTFPEWFALDKVAIHGGMGPP